jgi:MazG family protein
VFGDASVESAEDVKQQWHVIKRNEKAEAPSVSVLDSVPRMQPALMRAYRISVRAAREGFDWADLPGVFSKVDEEMQELREAVADSARDNTGGSREVLLEFGDLLFTMVNVARFLGVNPEAALMESTEKFENRFRHMEQAIKNSRRNLADMGQEEKDEFWDRAKAAE